MLPRKTSLFPRPRTIQAGKPSGDGRRKSCNCAGEAGGSQAWGTAPRTIYLLDRGWSCQGQLLPWRTLSSAPSATSFRGDSLRGWEARTRAESGERDLASGGLFTSTVGTSGPQVKSTGQLQSRVNSETQGLEVADGGHSCGLSQQLGLWQMTSPQADPGEVLGTQRHIRLRPELQKLMAWCGRWIIAANIY